MIKRRYYVIVDLEMCTVTGNARKKMRGNRSEIIQIGAVMVDGENRIVDEFSSYVQPEYGRIDSFIQNLTGIAQEMVENASKLRSTLMSFSNWIGDRDPVVLSWSESDYHQLKAEMDVKRIKNPKILQILDGWVDFQYSFDQMLGVRKQCALGEAMDIGRIQIMGRIHDGLCDAYNTARLFVKVRRQSAFPLKLVPICEYVKEEVPLCFTLGELFTPTLLAQVQQEEPVIVIEEKLVDNDWSIWRKLYGLFSRKGSVSDEQWNKLLFEIEMRKLNIKDFFGRGLFVKKGNAAGIEMEVL